MLHYALRQASTFYHHFFQDNYDTYNFRIKYPINELFFR